MSVLLAGKPELSVGFPRIKSTADRSDTWESRFIEGGKPPLADTTTPPADPSPGCGMCARSAADNRTQADPPNPANKSKVSIATIMDVAIRCTAPNCTCDGFTPSKPHIRSCDTCRHGWVAHALDKLGFRHLFNCHQVELVQPTVAFDVASLMLYGTQALPIRLKILLDRLFSVLQHDEVVHVLHGFGWTYEDYARGYILQDSRGQVLDRWTMPTREEEPLILQQFLRFGETKPIAQQLLLQESTERPDHVIHGGREYSDSDIKRFIQRTNRVAPTALPRTGHVGTPSLPQTPSAAAPLPAVSRPSRQPSSVSSTNSMSPTTGSPVNSPLSSSSPLNKLQNMQPYDYRRERSSPDSRPSEVPNLSFAQTTPLSSPTTTTSGFILSGSLSSTYTTASNSHVIMNSDLSATDEGSENDTNGAINLTQHVSIGSHLDSIFAAKKIRHLRKSANPMKRRWNPLMLSNLTTNPSTGKKRVQCHVCLKTFCDKGALKIHFSAVHLREMHKCTVDGCNMMFSSRRSRNRHSANPNPKLHTPNLRRKLSHHDGRSALPFPLIPTSGMVTFNSGSSLLGAPPTLHPAISDAEREKDDRVGHTDSGRHENLPSSTVEDNLEVSGRIGHNLQQIVHLKEDEALSLTKKPRLEQNGLDADISNDGDEGIDLTMKDENQTPNVNKGVRKRKSFNPTKCPVASDDDLQYVSTDDSSSDTFVDDNGLLESKSDDLSSDLLEDDSKDDDLDKDSDSAPPLPLPITSSYLITNPPTSVSTHIPRLDDRAEMRTKISTPFTANCFKVENLSAKEPEVVSLDLSKQRDPVIKPIPETDEVQESPLRHLETLSLGAFTGLINPTKSPFSNHIASSTGISFHAPGLGLASTAPTSASDSLNRDKIPSISSVEAPAVSIPVPSSGLSVNANDSDPDGQLSMLPMYRDASLIGAVDIPVDKENPRRCIACGKIFQNHFGVKTHYQNVHLKLMHKCTVEGCNAAFPSKRSRDRHSANLNLHRKLLSTTAEKGHYFEKASLFPYAHPGTPLRDDYFSRIYDPQSMPLNFADLYHGRIPDGFLPSSPFVNHLPAGPLGVMPSFHPAFMVPTTSTSGSSLHEGGTGISDGREDTPISSISSTPSPHHKSPSPTQEKEEARGHKSLVLDAELIPDSDGRFSCKFCQRLFVDAAHLRDHYEGTHMPDLVPCPAEDCTKVFLSATDREKHCDAEDHHHHHRAKRESPSGS